VSDDAAIAARWAALRARADAAARRAQRDPASGGALGYPGWVRRGGAGKMQPAGRVAGAVRGGLREVG
jgi:hypothetical protein